MKIKYIYFVVAMVMIAGCRGNNGLVDSETIETQYEEKSSEAIEISNKLDIKISENIRIFDGRTGDEVNVDSDSHIKKIMKLVPELEYAKTESYDGAAGSSYNLIFENEMGEVISGLSFGWPEDKVLINDTYYYFNSEQQYLLYSYIADVCFIEMVERNKEYDGIHSEISEVTNEKEELNRKVEALEEKILLLKNEVMISDMEFYWEFVWGKAFAAEGKFSEDLVEDINVLLQPVLMIDDEEGFAQVNPLQGFFYSDYDEVSEIDLSAFLRYCPLNDNRYDNNSLEEFEELKSHENWLFGETTTYDNMPVPIHRYRAEVIEDLFVTYAGITLDDLSGLGSEELIYLESRDAYYNFTSDFGPGFFVCTSGTLKGNVLTLYSGLQESGASLTIVREGDSYYINSFQGW